jgi:hypothetical protein
MMVAVVPVPAIDPGLMVQVPVAGRPLNATLPVATAHEAGCVIAPNTGVVVAPAGVLITTSADGSEVQPDAIVTVKLYVPGIRFGIIVLVPVPVIAPGLTVHVPLAGRPFSTTLPVTLVHEAGWVIVPGTGVAGVPGGDIITTSVEGRDIQPAALVMLKLYVPGIRFGIIVVVPDPVIPPGLMVHVPVAGRPFNTIVPVGVPHAEGCVTVPTTGAVGAVGGAFITTSADARDIHPAAEVTLKLYVPGMRFKIVALAPDPVIAPGLIVHVPLAGRPFNTTLPVVAIQEAGCVIEPTMGSVGATGAGLITISAEASDIHPGSL